MKEFTGGNVKNKKLMHAMTLMGALTLGAASQANGASGIEYSGSGFMTIGLGKMLGGTRANVSDYDCPCFNADYAQGGIYDGRSGLQWRPDTKIGVQGSASVDNFSLTAQLVARGADTGNVGLEWLYGSYKMNDKITFQLGRKRLPMFYYSDVQDVGVALPWAHLPPQLYGWEAVNYNGINVRYQDQFGDWSSTVNLLAGNETRKESGYWKVYYGRQNRTDVKWNNLVGGDLLLSKDWLETRLVYIQSDTQTRIVNGTWDPTIPGYDQTTINASFSPDPPYKQKIYGIAVNADYENWLIRTEYVHINRPGASWKDYANMIGIGYRYEKWQPMITYSKYWGAAVIAQGGDPTALEGHASVALTLRYDLTTSSALKVQYDDQRDQSGPNWAPNWGNARLLTVTYDTVF
jgi:hypothetical protein